MSGPSARPLRRLTAVALALFQLASLGSDGDGIFASASAVAPRSRRAQTRQLQQPASAHVIETAAGSSASVIVADGPVEEEIANEAVTADATAEQAKQTSTSSASANPIAQLVTYVKDSMVNFKDGLVQMNTDHRRCNDIRAKQRAFAVSNGTKRPRGVKGIQTGGISYEEYDCLRKGLVDRNKLFAVAVVSLCLPNYFVYYLWSFPDMMPSPFLKGKDAKEVSRERCHAVISTMLDIEKGARVAPWTSKLNPFGRKATERAMDRLGSLITVGCNSMEEYRAVGSNGGRMMLKKLRPQLYSSEPLTKQQRLLMGNVVPKQIIKGLAKAIGADPLNKGASPFGIGAVKHIESVTLADEFLVDQKIALDSISSPLLAEACSSRLIGGPGWSDDERREALASWLQETEISPRAMTKEDDSLHFNGNLARAALMCYNAVDGTRDGRADSSLLRVMYQGQKRDNVVLN